jgi:hypothetical protein
VLLPICQREENKKHRWSQREQVLKVIRNSVGGCHLSATDISVEDTCQAFFWGSPLNFRSQRKTAARAALVSGFECNRLVSAVDPNQRDTS